MAKNTTNINQYIADKQKLKLIIQYVCEHYNSNGGLGAIKLNKIFWFFDKYWFIENGESATSISHYWRQPRGPMIPDFYNVIKELEDDNILSVSTIGPNSFKQTKYNCYKKPDNILDFINSKQLELLDEIAQVIVEQISANEVSELSHKNCWHNFSNGSYIPIETVLWDEDDMQPSDKMMQWIEQDSNKKVA